MRSRYKKKYQLSPLIEHLDAFRSRIIRSVLGILVGLVICLIFSKPLLNVLLWPSTRANVPMELQVLKVQGMFLVTLQIGFFGGIILSLPYIFYQIWMLISTVLGWQERRSFPAFVTSASLLFLAGVAFAYMLILPFALEFFLKMAPPTIKTNISIDFYIGFAIRLMAVFGLIFQLPVISYFLSKIGVLTPEPMQKYRRYAIVVIFVIAAILTPPDPFTQILLAVPLIVLYEFSILLSKIVRKGKKHEEEQPDLLVSEEIE